MFAIDAQTYPRLLFTVGDLDLALAYAEMEGYRVTDSTGRPRKALSVDFQSANHHVAGLSPTQISPGVYTFSLRKTVLKCE